MWKNCANTAVANYLRGKITTVPDQLSRLGVEFDYFLHDRNETVFKYKGHWIGFKVVVEDSKIYVEYRGMRDTSDG